MAQVPIPGSSTRFYTVEARRFTGYDRQVPAEAVVIHRGDTTLSDRNARVVDPDRNGDPNDRGARWVAGEVFEDRTNGIEVGVTRATASGFNVTVNPSGGDDPASPHVRSSTPSPGQARVGFKPTVTANFDDVMDQDTLTGSNVQLYRSGAGSPVGATVTPGSDGRSVTLEPSSRLRAGKWYSVRLWRDAQGIEDLEGNALSGGGNYLVSETGGYVFWRFKVRS
jgi:hypothetical protein